jgi:hypothetical protein
MALGDELVTLAQAYYASEIKHVIAGTNMASAAADPSNPIASRIGWLDSAIAEIGLADADARRIFQLTTLANNSSDPAAAVQLQSARKAFEPFDCLRRMGVYAEQAKTWRGRKLSLQLGPIQPRPTPPDIGTDGGPPVAPPPDAATQVGILAALAGVVYAGWYFLIRRR